MPRPETDATPARRTSALTRLRRSAEAATPPGLKVFIKRAIQSPRVGAVNLGDLRRTAPISRWWGFARGTPVDRHYIGEFLTRHRDDIAGRVLEVGDERYTREFAGAKATSRDILNYVDLPGTTIVADLVDAPGIGDARFDCVICTQVLQFVTDPARAMTTLRRILAPGGTLLMTVPCISPLDPETNWDDRWRFTSHALRELAEGCATPGDAVEIESRGNVLAALAFFHGLAVEEFEANEMASHDPRFELIVTLRLRRAA